MFEPLAVVGGPLLTTETSTVVVTEVDTVELLFAGLGSSELLVTVAVLSTVGPGPMVMTSVNCALVPEFNSERKLQVTMPPLPASGVAHVVGGPVSCVRETKVLPG